uniref:Hamartin-like n=1 Tax=Sphaeramia orbicularis TaxID=375764 RepID=A0A673CJG4_9TELE
MAREQPNVGDLLPLLETSDLHQLEEIRGLINEQLSTERGSMLLNGLVDYFLETNSAQAMHILSSVREPHDKHLLDKMNECMTKQACRLPTLTLLGHVIRKQPSWIHKIARYPLLLSLLKCLKTDTDVVVLITGVLVLITLLPMIPQAGKQHLWEYFDIFGRLASWNLKNPGHVSEVYLIHLHASVYSLFHRLYGMYPCNFVSYLRSHYSMKENMETFEEVVKPMLEHVRIHPELVTGTKDHELDPTRWKRYEIHDIVIECAKVSLDPKEASCEEGYAINLPNTLTYTPATSSPPPTLSDDFPIISLPANTVQSSPPRKVMLSRIVMIVIHLELFQTGYHLMCLSFVAAITEELLKITEENQELPGLRGFDSPFYHTTETLTGCQAPEKTLPNIQPGGPVRDTHNVVSTPDKMENAVNTSGIGTGGGTPGLEQTWSFTPIDHHLHRSPSAPDDDVGKYGMFSPSPCSKTPPAPIPYESFFDLALPRAASLFVGKKTTEAVHKADGEEEGLMSASPLEVLDRLVQQGSDAHDKVLKRLPLPSKSADWTHFGGSAPLDELHTLRSQLLLLHNQLLYERYKREQHAVRNRRLLRRIINATALEEQNNAMKDQLNLQSVDITSLRESLQVEQQRYRQLWDDRETVVTRLHSQIRQLQQGRDDYYTKNQELQSKLQECQKRMDELEAELQRANNKICHTGHLLNQMTIKLSNSESTQQQMSFLNKQLLLLGEAHKLSMQELHHAGPDNTKEAQMLQVSYRKEVETLRQSLLVQGQKLEAAQQRVAELETLLTKKEHLIAEQKKFLEDVKCQAKAELQASDSRYQAQRRITQLLQTELLQLYSRVEMEAPAENEEADTRPLHDSPHGNGSTLSPGQPKASNSSKVTANSINGGQDLAPPLLVEPSSLSYPHADAPLTVGSYPSAKSFLGMRARELFRNKSESQCDEEQPPPPRLAGLAHGLKTELCVEAPCTGQTAPALAPVCPTPFPVPPPPLPSTATTPVTVPSKEPASEPKQRASSQESPRRKAGAGSGGGRGQAGSGRPRQQQLKIMDYNETHHEHS